MERNRWLDEQNAQLRESLQRRYQLVGESAPMLRLFDQIQRVAGVARPVLVLGERGTGKELVARAIHLAGGPPTRPMVTLNCAAFNDALLESELFGHEKGAFTGADSIRRGAFERADGGTLFLDEVGNMSVAFQEKILRVVEYGTFAARGRDGRTADHGARDCRHQPRPAADDRTPRVLAGPVRPANLRDARTAATPPARPRRGTARPALPRRVLPGAAVAGPETLSPAALAALRTHRFPGNVRELKNVIERAAYRSAAAAILPADLGLTAPDDLAGQTGTFEERTTLFARRLLAEALSQADGNQAAAARSLGLSYHQFRYFLKKHGLGAKRAWRRTKRG